MPIAARLIRSACSSEVLRAGADLGIAFDGDGDRVLMVDGNGVVLDGDELLFIIARHRAEAGRLVGRRRRNADDELRPRAGARRGCRFRSRDRKSVIAMCWKSSNGAVGNWAEKDRDTSFASI